MEIDEEPLVSITRLEGPCLFGRCVGVETSVMRKAKRALDVLIVTQMLFIFVVLIFPKIHHAFGRIICGSLKPRNLDIQSAQDGCV